MFHLYQTSKKNICEFFHRYVTSCLYTLYFRILKSYYCLNIEKFEMFLKICYCEKRKDNPYYDSEYFSKEDEKWIIQNILDLFFFLCKHIFVHIYMNMHKLFFQWCATKITSVKYKDEIIYLLTNIFKYYTR